MFLRNTADPDLQNFWIAQAKAIREANSVTKHRTFPDRSRSREGGEIMITIAVTGSSGKLGRHVVRDLHEHGYRPSRSTACPTRTRWPTPPCASTSPTTARSSRRSPRVDDRYDGVDAVVHLAAIPAPGLTTNAATFANNITATYNVFAAARAAGVTQHRLGVQRDRAGSARSTRRRPTSPSTRSTAAPRVDLLAGEEASRRRWRGSSAGGIRS